MERTRHTLLVGGAATEFAVEMGIPLAPTSTPDSEASFERWKAAGCQPNYWAPGTV